MNYSLIILNKKNITDFSKERNELLKKAKNDWAFFIDSDETISNFHDKVGSSFPISNQFSSYQFLRKNYFLGSCVGTDKIIRLVKKGTGKWERAVHEVWTPNDKSKVGDINEEITHNTADNLKDYLGKINNYSTLHALANGKEGKKSTLFKIIFYPLLKFMQTLFKSRHGVFSLMQAFHSFLSWSKLWIIQTKRNYRK